MERTAIYIKLKEIFVDVLDNQDITIQNSTSAEEVEGWDSLTHIQLVVAIEKGFNIRFTSKEIQSWNNVGELVDSINAKLV